MHGVNDVGQIEIHTGEIRICSKPLSNMDLLIHAKINGNSYLLNVESVNAHSLPITLKHYIAVIIMFLPPNISVLQPAKQCVINIRGLFTLETLQVPNPRCRQNLVHSFKFNNVCELNC
jgi:hypothetical protein